MFKLNLKIALRNLWKNKGITAINIGGLAIALAAFILVMLYTTFETTYDSESENYNEIYLVGRSTPDYKTNYTAPPFAGLLKSNFAEIVACGKMKSGFFEFPLNSNYGRFYSSKSAQMDFELAKMFNVIPSTGLRMPVDLDMYLIPEAMGTLFPNQDPNTPKQVIVGPKQMGDVRKVSGLINWNSAHSNIKFDLLVIGKEIGAGEDYGFNNYNTFIQVAKGTNIQSLTSKIEKLYHKTLLQIDPSQKERIKSTHIYLDPLSRLNLNPTAGSDSNYKVLIAIGSLGLLTLIIACFNFTNLSIAQATSRAKEVGVKKVLGAYRFQLVAQFLTEMFLQCFLATVVGLILAELLLPTFNMLFFVKLSLWENSTRLIISLGIILLIITLIAGTYPALILSGFKPSKVLKGNFQHAKESYWLRNGLLIAQFSIAVIFVSCLLIINAQLRFMQTQDVGFKASQVIAVKNMAIFNKPQVFAAVRDRIMEIDGVKSVSVATSLPDGAKAGSNTYEMKGNSAIINFLDVDFDYFETLNIELKSGRFFQNKFPSDTINTAIINEKAALTFGVKNPIGELITGCGIAYKIVGVVGDVKSQGFEKPVEPTIYAIKNPCGNYKTNLIIRIDQAKIPTALTALKENWSSINKLDGEDFRYHFLDELYGKLFQKQQQLQSIFLAAAVLTIIIAVLGLYAFAKYITNGRIKEIALRKILGASDFQLLQLLNSSFIRMVIFANLIAIPLAYVLSNKWLDSFAYRIDLPYSPFICSALISLGLTLFTVSFQVRRAIQANPVDALKYE